MRKVLICGVAALLSTAALADTTIEGIGKDGRLKAGWVAVPMDYICKNKSGATIWCDTQTPVNGVQANVRDADGTPYLAFVIKIGESDRHGKPTPVVSD